MKRRVEEYTTVNATCDSCGGSGQIDEGDGSDTWMTTCGTCGGSGSC